MSVRQTWTCKKCQRENLHDARFCTQCGAAFTPFNWRGFIIALGLTAVPFINTRNEVLSIHEIYVGNVNASVIRPAEVIRPAVRDNAPSIIVVHNHPSGDPTPSGKTLV